ncbi:metal dependent phosphohydrolase [Desulfurispirillum indicum S5]|uniref:Metal dependent phosphohydrolase n=1 Tax=Desulfurispirillum indicum (strain ATCC BAA-1389 / DSM 22839 / S5) TaxID=653733 RepID=E6W4Q7_DESIS|nr:HD domain-containing phosphohydrolase [Desulfurispirillum indicum]ADU64785.1 metal dependent phosphohydrolase [Desulfurispirillum indicum S5]
MDFKKTIKVDSMSLGYTTAEEVRDGAGNLVVEEGIRLYSPAVKRLKDAGIREIVVYKGKRRNPQSQERLKDWEPGQTEQTPYRHEMGIIRASYDFLATLLHNNSQQISRGQAASLSPDQISGHLQELMESYLRNYRTLLSLSGMVNKQFPPQVQHALRRTLISLVLAAHVNKARREPTIHMATAALLADIGMLRIPQDLLSKPGKLSDDERRLLETHPVIGARLLQEKGFPQEVLLYVLQHHERFDGTGYPRQLGSDKISLGGALVGLCDAYCAMTSSRSYRSAENPTLVLVKLLQGKGVVHHPELVDKLVRYIGVFPIGSIVKLSTGEVGVVNQHSPEAPTAPRVAVALDGSGKKVPRPFLRDLKLETDIKVARAIDPENVNLDVAPLLYLSSKA